MQPNLPQPVDDCVQSLFEALPIEQAMTSLVVTRPGPDPLVEIVQSLVKQDAIGARPPLVAGLWLYVDELDRSHKVSQGMDDDTGAFWHGIMHRREGDFSNSHYWFRRAGRHPAMAQMRGPTTPELPGSYDGHQLIDQVAAAHQEGQALDELIRCQRDEWIALFSWCAGR